MICRLAAQNFFFSSILVHHMGQFKLCYYLNWNRVLFRHPECTCRCWQLHMDIRPRCASTYKSSKTTTSLSCVKLHMQTYIHINICIFLQNIVPPNSVETFNLPSEAAQQCRRNMRWVQPKVNPLPEGE
jgi:hypothetical protein